MRKGDKQAVDQSDAAAASSSSSSWASPSQPPLFRYVRSAPPSQLQFFVRMMSEGKTPVVQASSCDTVESVHEKIYKLTRIPVNEQRLIYMGKQLQWEQSLAKCAIQKDASLQLVGRMRSTEYPRAWKIMDDMISVICRLCKGEDVPQGPKIIRERLDEYLSNIPKNDYNMAPGHLQIFMSSSAPSALIMLYMSPVNDNKKIAEESILHFLGLAQRVLPRFLCAPIVLEFCKLLRRLPQYELLCSSCRTCLASLPETIGLSRSSKNSNSVEKVISVEAIFPFISEIADRLSNRLVSDVDLPAGSGPLQIDVNDFALFLPHIRTAIREQSGFKCPIPWPPSKQRCDDPKFVEEIRQLYLIFKNMLMKMDLCLLGMEKHLPLKSTGEGDMFCDQWSQYLAILKELNAISKLYVGSEQKFWTMMRERKRSLCTLIVRCVKRTDDNQWLLEHKEVTNFEARRHMAMMLFPELREDYDDQHEMLIDRANLLVESFNYVSEADPESLRGSLFMEFKNEEPTGPVVVREWLYLVCQRLFNPQFALFVACPNDRSRFYPNPASRVDPLHLKYFKFAGRVIAMALMRKVQVGVALDRVFFLQLAGLQVSLEDIREADPALYCSCKQMLEMDPEFIDANALGLTFVREVDELGSKKVVELLPGGANLAVNSKNRNEYVNLLVRHQFMSSISPQVSHFAQGFGDILSCSRRLKFLLRSLEHEDLDFMLRGSAVDICIQVWKAHTDYNGYKETDCQIVWFWKIVSELTPNQKNELLFFWTSMKHLPVEGFRGLPSRLYIYKSPEPITHLPTSHSCFYRLCFPAYPSMSVMRDRLLLIVQEHVVSSFGTW